MLDITYADVNEQNQLAKHVRGWTGKVHLRRARDEGEQLPSVQLHQTSAGAGLMQKEIASIPIECFAQIAHSLENQYKAAPLF